MPLSSANAPFPCEFDGGTDPQLQNLRLLAHQESNVPTFVAEFARVVMKMLDAHSVRVWLGSEIDRLIEVGCVSRSNGHAAPQATQTPNRELMASVLVQQGARVVSSADFAGGTPGTVQSSPNSWMLFPITGSSAVHGVVACELSVGDATEPQSNAGFLIQLILDASLPFFDSQFTRELLVERRFDRQFQDFCRELHVDPTIATTPATIATEFQRLFQTDRNWVLMPSGSRWRVKAAGGIPSFQRRSAVIRKLEKLVALTVRTKQPFRWSAGQSTSNLLPRVLRAFDQYLDEVHVVAIRIEPLLQPDAREVADGEPTRARVIGIVVCEWFQPAEQTFEESRWKAARQQAAIAIQNASDWSRAPIARLLRNWRRTRSWKFVAGWGTAITVIGVAVVFGASMPMEFTIDAMGELHPVRQRHVFATTAGIVRKIAATTGAEVSEGTTLLELDSPELELEIRRTGGELQTTEKRIASIEASRLDFGFNAPDSASQMNTLAGELKEQRQKLENLRRELELLSSRRDELKIVSPIKGRVVTWDLERQLLQRPVSRGQRLLTVSDTAGPWELELRVNDNDTNDLYNTMQANESVSLDFVAVTMPERVHSTKLKSVSNTVEIRSQGDAPSLLCRADVPDTLGDSAVEGMSVRGRIHCGQRAAVVVLFTKLWRAVQEHVLFPWGW